MITSQTRPDKPQCKNAHPILLLCADNHTKEPDSPIRYTICPENASPTVGREIKKTRPYLVVSPDEMNRHIATVIVAPMTTKGRIYPTRISCRFQRKSGQIVLDQLRTVDRVRLIRRFGQITERIRQATLTVLAEMFAD